MATFLSRTFVTFLVLVSSWVDVFSYNINHEKIRQLHTPQQQQQQQQHHTNIHNYNNNDNIHASNSQLQLRKPLRLHNHDESFDSRNFQTLSDYSLPKPGCDFCEKILTELDNFLASNSTWNTLTDIAVSVCELIRAGNNCIPPWDDWQCEMVCETAVSEFSLEVQFLVIQYINPALLCYSIGFDCEIPDPTPEPTPIPDILNDDLYPRNGSEYEGIGYILHIPDIHLDPWAKPYTVDNCGMPVCCRLLDDNETYLYNVTYAGYYGSYKNCDASPLVVDSMWKFIKNNITKEYGNDLDFVIWVGDAVPHDVNNQSKWTHLQILKTINDDLKDTFGEIPVYANLGNHEGMPVNQFEGPGYDNWLLNAMGEQWSQWIDNKYVLNDTILPSAQMSYAGYYTTLIRPGFRLIALHTGYTEAANFYLTWNHQRSRDMASQLSWFQSVLARAKELKEKVLVIQHYPLDSFEKSLQNQWYNTFRAYSDIIVTIIAGHSHSDQYRVFGSFPPNVNATHKNTKDTKHNNHHNNHNNNKNIYNNDNNNFASGNGSNPFAVMYIAGSVTTYGGRNPAFRVYSYNRTTFEMNDFIQYRFDLNKSNNLLEPIWFNAYSMKSEYSMKSLQASEFKDLAERMYNNDGLFDKYQSNYNNGYKVSLDKNSTICSLMSATYMEYEYCRQNIYKSDITLDQYYKEYGTTDVY